MSRGPEYRVERRTSQMPRRRATSRSASSLAPLGDLAGRGWYSGDLHVHMNYGGAYRNTPRRLAFQARAEDLAPGGEPDREQGGRDPGHRATSGRPDPASTPSTLIVHDQEYHTSYWGHVGLLGLRDHVLLPATPATPTPPPPSLSPTNAEVFGPRARAGRASSATCIRSTAIPIPPTPRMPSRHELPVDVALGKVDYYEALGFVDDPMATAHVWYRLLNCGFRLPAGAGTDAMANFASLRGPVGMNRVYVQSGGAARPSPLARRAQGRAHLRHQRPAAGAHRRRHGASGDELRVRRTAAEMSPQVRLRSNVPVDHLEIVGNGEVVRDIPLAGDRTGRRPLACGSRWTGAAGSCSAPGATGDLSGAGPVSLRDDQPDLRDRWRAAGRSPEDARYFVAWIDRMRAAVEAHRDWNTEAEREETLDMLAQARAEYERRSRD